MSTAASPSTVTATARHAPGSRPVRRLLALGWRHKVTCLGVLAFQVGAAGAGRRGAGRQRGGDRSSSGARWIASAPPVHWPFGLAPPAGWSTRAQLVASGGAVLLMAAARALLTYGHAIAVGKLVHLQIVPELRTRVFDKLQRLSFRFFDRNASGSIINRVTGDVQSVRAFVDGVLLQGAVILLSLGVYLVYMLRTHVGLTLACLAPTPLIWLATSRFSRWARPAYEKNRELADAMVLALSEGMKGMPGHQGLRARGARAGALPRQEPRRAGPAAGDLPARQPARPDDLVHHRDRRRDPAAVRRVAGRGAGDDAGRSGGVRRAPAAVLGAGVGHGRHRQHARAEPDRRAPRVRGAGRAARGGEPAAGRCSWRGRRARSASTTSRFGYGQLDGHPGDAVAPVLRGLDFAVEPGQCVAIFGATGAGKSTLLSLIPRFYDPGAGRVLVDGIDVRDAGPGVAAAAASAWCSRRACCFAPRSPTTSPSATPRPGATPIERAATRRRRARLHRRAARRLRHRARGGGGEPVGRAAAAPRHRARAAARARRSCCSTIRPAASTPRPRRRCCRRSIARASGRTTLIVANRTVGAAARRRGAGAGRRAHRRARHARRAAGRGRPLRARRVAAGAGRRARRRARRAAEEASRDERRTPRRASPPSRTSGRWIWGSSGGCSRTRGRTRACATPCSCWSSCAPSSCRS